MPLLIDAHEDLAWNALTFGRDYRRSALVTRQLEIGTATPENNGNTLLGLPEYLAGQVAVVFGTLFASPAAHTMGAWDTIFYKTPAEAHRHYNAQIDQYRRLADEHPQFVIIENQGQLDRVLASWAHPDETQRQVGLVILMEGADAIREPEEAAWWQERGLRIVGLAWSQTRYAGGTAAPGPLTPEGRRLLRVMSDLGLMLDLSHASDESFLQALDVFDGTVMVTHATPRAFARTSGAPERFLSDEMIRRVTEKGGVIGLVPYCRFLKGDWVIGDGRLPLTTLADAVDYVCQLTGSVAQVGLGTDFDGGFGVERVPTEIDTIADLQKIAPLLKTRGYSDADINAIFNGNWQRILRAGLPG